ncbi:hypothetical protein ACFLQI_01490 [Candidatus Undinarchaeota archaeon]
MQLSLLPVGTIPNALLNYLKYTIPEHLDFEKVVREREVSLPSSYDALRKQYSVPSFFSIKTDKVSKYTLMITDVDLFIEPVDYIFGHYKENTALVSMQRLNPVFTGNDNPETLRTRVLNESLHQLGHALGLDHCKKRCVMKLAPGISDVDERPVSYCSFCSKPIKKAIQN